MMLMPLTTLRPLFLFGAGVLLAASPSYGALFTPKGPSERTIETSVGNIPVYSVVEAVGSGKKDPADTLTLTGAGIRVKKVLLFQASVYAVRSYAHLTPATPITAENILKSPTRALDINFLRDLSEAQIRESFLKAMELNSVPVDLPSVKEFLAFVARDVKEGEEVQLLARQGSEDTVSLESGTRKLTLKGKDLANHIWKIWFGISDDSGLEELKARLSGQKRAS